MTGESYPTIALGPVTVTPIDEAAQEGARFLGYRLEQQIMRICVAGMLPLLPANPPKRTVSLRLAWGKWAPAIQSITRSAS